MFAHPRTLDIDPHCFVAPEHAVLFDAIQEMAREFPPRCPTREGAYDDISLALVVEFAGQRASQGVLGHMRFLGTDFKRWVASYILQEIITLPADADAIDQLATLVRECPRCGH